MKDAKLVYSSDDTLNKRCLKCKELFVECRCVQEESAVGFAGPVNIRVEKQGRGGKTVTVIERFPKNETFLKNLCAIFKKRCGTGGTYLQTEKFGVIEIQGDKRDLVKTILEKEKIKFKG